MKTAIIALTLTLSASALQMPTAFAQDGKGGKVGSRIFTELELSETQKQDIKQIMRQTKDDKSVFAGDREAYKQQMQALMSSPTWDADAARALVSERIKSSVDAELSKANARNLAFNVLTEEQKSTLAEKRSEREIARVEKSEDKRSNRGRKGLSIKRLEKRLDLTSEQVAAIEQIRASQKAEMSDVKESLKTSKQAERALIHSADFDEQAWLSLRSETEEARIEAAAARAYQRYQILSVLDDSQQEALMELMKKARGKQGMRRGNRMSKTA